MSNDDLDNLSDVELHYRLIQSGFPNVPVTETTRNILIKKLRNHTKNMKMNTRQNRSVTASTSSQRSLGNSVESNSNYSTSRYTTGPRTEYSYGSFNPSVRPRVGIRDNQQLLTESCQSQNERSRTSPKMYAPPPILASDSEEDSDYLNYLKSSQTRKKDTLNSTYKYNYCNNISPGLPNSHFGVVNRLLSFRDRSMQKPMASGVGKYGNNESDVSFQHISQGRKIIITRPRRIFTEFVHRLNLQHGIKQIFIPYLLIGGLVTYLLVIMFMYMLISPNILETIRENNTQFVKCPENDGPFPLQPSSNGCIDSDKLSDAIEIDKELLRILQERSKAHYCDDEAQPTDVSAREFVQHLYKTYKTVDVQKINSNLLAADHLIAHNPQWNVKIVKTKVSPTLNIGFEKDASTLEFNVHYDLVKPHLPLMCIIRNKVQKFFVIIGSVVLTAITGALMYLIVRYFRNRYQDRILAVESFTGEIINELLHRASLSETPEDREVIINHLRDKLIPLKKRNALMWSWNEALKLLEANDSRIQFGETVRNGEEYRCMKWVGNVVEVQDPNCRKQWQSPAFNNTNKVLKPPTPCLKIRHMFDSNEINYPNLKQIIEDAIREKAGPRCKIVDIQLDRESCCVYVRCATEEDAGIVHSEINGWWFDRRLVSIKFLRLPRYLARFPNSNS